MVESGLQGGNCQSFLSTLRSFVGFKNNNKVVPVSENALIVK